MIGRAILFSEMTPEYDWEDRFNRWYDTHRIPLRMAAPGFLSAQRYKNAERPNYLVVYELDDLAALETPEYRKIDAPPNGETRWMLANASGISRYVGEQIAEQRRDDAPADPTQAPILYAVFFSVPDERADEFNAWYDQEHTPMLLGCADWLCCRRFFVSDADPQPWTHLALHYLADMRAFDAPERAASRETEWRRRLADEPWFNASQLVFERWGQSFLGTHPATRASA